MLLSFRTPSFWRALGPAPYTETARKLEIVVLTLGINTSNCLMDTACLLLRQKSQRGFPARPYGFGPLK